VTGAPIIHPDRRRPEPLWHQVEQAIRMRIDNGEWPTGSQIPAEDRLCEMLGVSRITVRHAIRNLEQAGLLRREHGRGTFVGRETIVAGTRDLTSFTTEMSHLGLVAGSRVLDAALVQAAPEVAAALGLDEGALVVRIRRLRYGGSAPIGIQTAHLSAERVPGFLDEGPVEGSLYERLRSRYGIAPLDAHEVYRVALAGDGDAALLDVPAGSPAFVIERTSVDARGPFEFTVSVMRGDRYEIRANLRS
jgi:GntR family transcriptional regulator